MEKSVATTVANMFSKTTFVFALLALFTVQSSAALYLEKVDERSLDDLVEKAKEAIRKLDEIVGSAVENAVATLIAFQDKFLAHAYDLIYGVNYSIAVIVQKVKIQIEHIKKQAENLGDDIKKCIAENEAQLEQLPKNTIEKMLACSSEETKQVKDIVQAAAQHFRTLKFNLGNLPRILKDCIASEEPERCVNELVAQVVKDITGIPAEIQATVNKVMEFVNPLQEGVDKCAIAKFNEASQEAAAIGVNVAKCVPGKIEA